MHAVCTRVVIVVLIIKLHVWIMISMIPCMLHDKANESTILISHPPVFMRAGGHYSLSNIVSFWGCGFLELIGTAQIINKKEAWLAFQGNNEGRCGRLKQTRAGTKN